METRRSDAIAVVGGCYTALAPYYYGSGSDAGSDEVGVGGFFPRADPGALSYPTYGFIHHTDGCFFFTISVSVTFLTCCAYDADDTSRVAFTVRCGIGCSATAHNCVVK
jgi:hypothetical protein